MDSIPVSIPSGCPARFAAASARSISRRAARTVGFQASAQARQ